MRAKYDYHRPRTLEDAWRLRAAEPGARFIAGGTDVMVHLRKRLAEPPTALISLRAIDELKGIASGATFRIGALATVTDLLEHADLRVAFPALAEAAGWLGSTQIRNVATIGGNIANASPAADLVPPLLVNDARLEVRSASGSREIGLEEFFQGPGQTALVPGEIVTAILVERPPARARCGYLRKGRVRMDLALAGVAARVEPESGGGTVTRLAAAAVAPIPLRLRRTEELLAGKVLTDDLVRAAGESAVGEISPISDVRCSAAYRRTLVGVYVRRLLADLSV